MKHVVLSPLFPPDRYGGIEVIAERLCAALATTDEVVVLSAAPRAATVTHRQAGRVEVWEVPGHFFSPLAVDAANAAVLDLVRPLMRGVDVVHCHDWFLADVASILASRGVPLVGYFHTVKALERSRLRQKRTGSRRYAEEKQQLLASRSDVVAVYSEFMSRSVRGVFGLDGTDIVTFRCGPTLPLGLSGEPTTRDAGSFRITYLGRLAAEKGIDLLLSAFLSLGHEEPASTLRIIGSGPIAQNLIDMAHASPHGTRVSFESFTTDAAQLIEAYASSDLVVVPSRFEPYGLVAAEALTLGVPVAVAASGGLPEIVGHGNYGEVFASDCAEALGDRIEAVRADPIGARRRAADGQRIHTLSGLWQEATSQINAAVLNQRRVEVG